MNSPRTPPLSAMTCLAAPMGVSARPSTSRFLITSVGTPIMDAGTAPATDAPRTATVGSQRNLSSMRCLNGSYTPKKKPNAGAEPHRATVPTPLNSLRGSILLPLRAPAWSWVLYESIPYSTASVAAPADAPARASTPTPIMPRNLFLDTTASPASSFPPCILGLDPATAASSECDLMAMFCARGDLAKRVVRNARWKETFFAQGAATVASVAEQARVYSAER
mmetsp:Transcript_62315/g.171338  ORF Transcript_62315/g.171338 Transcript_62315/m.171338 type:complete len:223 (-) Transcript_62315:27-695(-)